MTRDSVVEVDGLRFDVRQWGPVDGPSVLLLHGFPENASMWEDVAGLLPTLRCVAPDQRGYSSGARPTEVEDYHVDRLVDDALALLDALGLDQVHLVGHDWGAIVAWHLVARSPDRVSALTAVSVPHPAAVAAALADGQEQRTASAYIHFFRTEPAKAEEVLMRDDAAALREIFAGSQMSESSVARFVDPLREPGALRAVLCWYRAMSRSSGELPPATVPTTYLWGDRDAGVAATAATRCGDHVSADYRFVPMPGVSHWLPEQRPEAVAEAVATAASSRP